MSNSCRKPGRRFNRFQRTEPKATNPERKRGGPREPNRRNRRAHPQPSRSHGASASAGAKYRIGVLGRTRNALEPIAIALREAAIPFRAVDLEQSSDRPEVLDALALGRALPILSTASHGSVCSCAVVRTSALGTSHAHGGDQPDLLEKPLPQVIAEQIHLLGADSHRVVDRVLHALQSRLRYPQPCPRRLLELGWSRSGSAWAVRIAWTKRRKPTSNCFGGASTVCPTAHRIFLALH